ncbi:MAG: hypothetical protein P8Y84_09060 [Desulfuromonadales bacterium]|jgi:hypothetical protein
MRATQILTSKVDCSAEKTLSATLKGVVLDEVLQKTGQKRSGHPSRVAAFIIYGVLTHSNETLAFFIEPLFAFPAHPFHRQPTSCQSNGQPTQKRKIERDICENQDHHDEKDRGNHDEKNKDAVHPDLVIHAAPLSFF